MVNSLRGPTGRISQSYKRHTVQELGDKRQRKPSHRLYRSLPHSLLDFSRLLVPVVDTVDCKGSSVNTFPVTLEFEMYIFIVVFLK